MTAAIFDTLNLLPAILVPRQRHADGVACERFAG